jgi:extradiol dioxygenase family protein
MNPISEEAVWPDELDALIASGKHHTSLLENESVRMLDARIPAGDRTPLHTHRWPSVHYVVSLSDFVRRDAAGKVMLDSRTLPPAALSSPAWWSAPLAPHTLENVGQTELRVISVELKNNVTGGPANSVTSITCLDHMQLTIPAGKEAETRAFFGGLLGMTEDAKPAELAVRGGCWFSAPGAKLHVSVDREFAPQKKGHPAFCVTEIDALARRLEQAGRAVTWDNTLPDRARFFVNDPFGNRIEFMRQGDGFSQK